MNRPRAFSRVVRTGSSGGFSLLEVLMALIVTSVLAATFLGVQRHSMRLTEINLGIWDSLNLGQEILMSRQPKDLASLPSWAAWPTAPGARFRILRERTTDNSYLETVRLEVEATDYGMSLEWPSLLPLPKVDLEKRKSDVTF